MEMINKIKNSKKVNYVVRKTVEKRECLWTIGVIIFVLAIIFFDLSSLLSVSVRDNIANAAKFLNFIIAAFVVWFVIKALLGRKYSIRLEKLSFGGMNLLFNTTDTLYRNSVLNFLDTKRSLFIIRPEFDNFSEVFDSYYQTYTFFRQEMKILDPVQDKKLYDETNEILMVLNKFLTKNQNNYRRWYKFVSESKDAIISVDGGDKRFFYDTPINDVQVNYYDYDNLVREFKSVNDFFSGKVKDTFSVNVEKWDW